MLIYAILCLASFVAGLTDSMVGGGGLIQLPILFLVFPHANQATVLGTNKMSSVFGTTAAVAAYTRRVRMDWGLAAVASVFAFALSRVGAQLVTRIHPAEFKPFVLLLLIVMAAFTFFHRDFGAIRHERVAGRKRLLLGAAIGCALGFYDGFFGPGTGSILIFLFIGVIGLDFLAASATAKWVNMSTNLGALVFFIASGHVLYRYALPMAAFNILGGITGARLAIARGNRFVRIFFLAIILLVIGRYAQDVVLATRQ